MLRLEATPLLTDPRTGATSPAALWVWLVSALVCAAARRQPWRVWREDLVGAVSGALIDAVEGELVSRGWWSPSTDGGWLVARPPRSAFKARPTPPRPPRRPGRRVRFAGQRLTISDHEHHILVQELGPAAAEVDLDALYRELDEDLARTGRPLLSKWSEIRRRVRARLAPAAGSEALIAQLRREGVVR